MAALLRELVGLWPLGVHELEAYIAHSLVPAARRIVAALQGTTNRLPLGRQ
jgi:hypothetical protein